MATNKYGDCKIYFYYFCMTQCSFCSVSNQFMHSILSPANKKKVSCVVSYCVSVLLLVWCNNKQKKSLLHASNIQIVLMTHDRKNKQLQYFTLSTILIVFSLASVNVSDKITSPFYYFLSFLFLFLCIQLSPTQLS